MTAKQLIKRLEKLVAEHGNVHICVDWQAIRDSCNGVFDIVDVQEADFDSVRLADGDGFTEYTKAGLERQKRCVVLR